jgi:osmotically-inducible protein OsmY
MKLTFVYKVLVPSAILSLGLVLPGFAQSHIGAISSDRMSTGAQSMEQGGSDTAAAEDVYNGTAIAIHDTAITVRVKAALHDDSTTEHSDIHVTTANGVVTLRGNVRSTEVSQRAFDLAQNTDGVKEVNNELRILGTTVAD